MALAALLLWQGSTCEDQDYLLPPEPLQLVDAAPGEAVVVEIDQPVRGLTSVDFRIINEGAEAARFTVAGSACLGCRFDSDCPGDVSCEASGFCAEPGGTPCGTPVDASFVSQAKPPGEGDTGRFHEGQLGLADHVHLEFACLDTPCSGTMEYTLLVRQPDCSLDTDCASSEVCDPEIGVCRADPASAGCQAAGARGGRSRGSWLALVAVCAVVLGARRRRDGGRRRPGASLAALLCLAAVVLGSAPASAQPADFRRTQVYIHPTVQADRFFGALHDGTGWGLGMGVTQGVQFGWLGVNVTLDTDFYLTRQAVPPFTRGLQHAAVRVAARLAYPVWDFRLLAEVGVQRMSFISNPLVSETGDALAYHALGGAVGLRYDGLRPLYFELWTSFDSFVDLDDSRLLGVGLSIGVRSLL